MVYCTQDVAVRTRDFEGAMPGLTRVFPAAKHHYLFIPEIGAIEEAAGTNVDKPHPTDSIDVAKEMGISRCEGQFSVRSLVVQSCAKLLKVEDGYALPGRIQRR